MSAATKRRIVEKEVAENLVELHADQIVARILAGRGNNLHEIELDGGDTCLASMPTKVHDLSSVHSPSSNRSFQFRRTVWVKRGDYVVCAPIDEGNKVKVEIAHVLTRADILHNVEQARFPQFFIDTDSTLSKLTNVKEQGLVLLLKVYSAGLLR